MEDRHLKILLVLSLSVATLRGDFISDCPKECKCALADGNKLANCSYSQLTSIPSTVSSETENLDLSGNEIKIINTYAFRVFFLHNLKTLTMRECKLKKIQKGGLSGLYRLNALDLSNNELKKLRPDTFQETSNVRWILLNDNQLRKLEDGLFNNLPYLEKVELSNNRIVTIGTTTFVNVPQLNTLNLDGNKLEWLNVDTLSALTNLSNLDIHDNPWKCDCNLRPLRNWIIRKHLFTAPIACEEPSQIQGRTWQELNPSDFACYLSIVYPPANTTLDLTEANATLSCQVDGNPLPEVNWVHNAKIIDGSNKNEGKYYLSESSDKYSKWVNLTIVDAAVIDNGQYLCTAKNAGGVEERNLTLVVYNFSEVCKTMRLDPSMSSYYCSICSCT